MTACAWVAAAITLSWLLFWSISLRRPVRPSLPPSCTLHSSGLRSITRAINSCTAGLPSCVARQDRQVPPSTRAQFIAAYRGEGGPDHVTLGRASVNVAGIKELGQTLSVALRYCEGPDRDRSSVYPQASPST